jgi:hypothetical protein
MQFTVPCEVVARLSTVLGRMPDNANEWFRSIRYDNGVLVVSNRKIIAAEYVGGPSGVAHIVAEPALIEQCRTEGNFGSSLEINIIEAMRFTTAKTTLGYAFPGNAGVWSAAANDFDQWRTLARGEKKLNSAKFMRWYAEEIAMLASSSPSGVVCFPEKIDPTRAIVVRDSVDLKWCGLLQGNAENEGFFPATLPDWI